MPARDETKFDGVLNLVIALMIALTLGVGGWLVYQLASRQSLRASLLPVNAMDFRGKEAPHLYLLEDSNNPGILRALEQDRVLLAFLLTSCPACNLAKPLLDELALEEDVGVIGIFAESEEAVSGYLTNFPRFNDPERILFDEYRATSVPAVFVLERGVIVEQTVGWPAAIGNTLRHHTKEVHN